jgi:hypothetical protein
VVGASNYTYAEATWTLGPARLDRLAHAHLFPSSTGVPAMVVSDNLRLGRITKTCLYEPAVNGTYAEMAAQLQRFHRARAAASGA